MTAIETGAGAIEVTDGCLEEYYAVVDSYEDPSLYEDTTKFEFVETFTQHREFAIQSSQTYDAAELGYVTQPEKTPEIGDIFEVDFTLDTATADMADNDTLYEWQFAADGEGVYNLFQMNFDDGEFTIWYVDADAGTYSPFAGDYSFNYEADTHYRARIVWDDGTLGGSAGDWTGTITNVDTGVVETTISANDTRGNEEGSVSMFTRNKEGITIQADLWRILNRP